MYSSRCCSLRRLRLGACLIWSPPRWRNWVSSLLLSHVLSERTSLINLSILCRHWCMSLPVRLGSRHSRNGRRTGQTRSSKPQKSQGSQTRYDGQEGEKSTFEEHCTCFSYPTRSFGWYLLVVRRSRVEKIHRLKICARHWFWDRKVYSWVRELECLPLDKVRNRTYKIYEYSYERMVFIWRATNLYWSHKPQE